MGGPDEERRKTGWSLTELGRLMRVQVRLFGNLRDRLETQRGRGQCELPERASLQDLIAHLDIPERQAQMVLVNGEPAPRSLQARRGWRLVEGDTVSIFPPLAGG